MMQSLETELRQLISQPMAWQYRIVPKERDNGQVRFLTDTGEAGLDALEEELEVLLGITVVLEAVSGDELSEMLHRFYPKAQGERMAQSAARVDSEEFIFDLINEARGLGSSDIHLEPYEEKSRVRIRIDGQLIERYQVPKERYPALVNKIKILANLDISEKRLPQDGRIFYKRSQHKFDIRVSVLPALYGEKVVLRILSNDATSLALEAMGMEEEELMRYREGIKQPNGILLISGPTGSGKTTTLYATLKELNTKERNILTIEDPIEYTLEGINQVQLKESIGLDFGKALRTFLRQDPDIIMVGEIRDPDTANMAIRAALTGHLVLSTIHTNSAWGTVSRLIDMGIPPYLIASTLNTTVAQRLVRLLCPDCKVKEPYKQGMLPPAFTLPEPLAYHWVAKGCATCYYTGYKGRKALYEVIPIDHDLAERIKNNDLAIADVMKQKNIRSLSVNAFSLLRQGESSVNEIYSLLYAS